MANVLRHQYDRIDMNIVWDTVKGGDLDGLTAAAKAELKHSGA